MQGLFLSAEFVLRSARTCGDGCKKHSANYCQCCAEAFPYAEQCENARSSQAINAPAKKVASALRLPWRGLTPLPINVKLHEFNSPLTRLSIRAVEPR